jgi:thiamine kinase-like enzyme
VFSAFDEARVSHDSFVSVVSKLALAEQAKGRELFFDDLQVVKLVFCHNDLAHVAVRLRKG